VDEGWFRKLKNGLLKTINVGDLKLSEFYWRKIAVCFEADVFHFAKLFDYLGLRKLTFHIKGIFNMSSSIIKSIATITYLYITTKKPRNDSDHLVDQTLKLLSFVVNSHNEVKTLSRCLFGLLKYTSTNQKTMTHCDILVKLC